MTAPPPRLGSPRLHLRSTASTNDRARALASAGAPHGTLVTAAEQTAGRGRQGRTWSAPAGAALLMSLVLRGELPLLPLAAGVAVAEVVGPAQAQLKWPNDVLVEGRKVAGILVEGRPGEGWSVLGIGINVAVELDSLPVSVRGAGTLGLAASEIEPLLSALLRGLERWLAPHPAEAVLAAWRARDALLGREVRWSGGTGTGAGVDGEGRLVVALAGGGTVAVHAGEVHLAVIGSGGL